GNGLFNQLRVQVEVDLARADFYHWSASLYDSRGREIDFDSRQGSIGAGKSLIDLVFDGRRIGENGVNGPYLLQGLLIFGNSGPNIVSPDVGETQPYLVGSFEGAPVNRPPVADAGRDTSVECGGPGGTAVILNGSYSHDPDGDSLTYVWRGPF